MLVLGIETSCDETAAALVDNGAILSNIVASQIDLHAKFGGIVPEVAARKHVETIGYVIKDAIDSAKRSPTDIEAIAVTSKRGLVGSLLVGVAAAKSTDGNGVTVDVTDTGPGISEADQANIFEKFYQADPTVTREHGGAGLGLGIAKDLTAILGGRLSFTTEPGKGTTFTLYLPMEVPEAQTAEPSTQGDASMGAPPPTD